MPIRFRCVYCDKLLGIAKRKAGAVVNCPQCNQPLIVPTPDPEPEPTGGGPDRLFEGDDPEAVMEPNADLTFRGGVEAPVPAPLRAPPQPLTFPTVPPVRPVAPPPRPEVLPTGIVLTTGRLILLFAFVLLLVGGAFAGGYLIGKG